jgi:hypothetical protein
MPFFYGLFVWLISLKIWQPPPKLSAFLPHFCAIRLRATNWLSNSVRPEPAVILQEHAQYAKQEMIFFFITI